MAGPSYGMEHVYFQEWLVQLLRADPVITAGLTGTRVGESPVGTIPLPAIMFRADQSAPAGAQPVGTGRSMVQMVYAVEATILNSGVEPLLRTANRIDVLLTRPATSRNIEWEAGDGAVLRIKNIYRDGPSYSDVMIMEQGTQNYARMLGGRYAVQCSVELPADLMA